MRSCDIQAKNVIFLISSLIIQKSPRFAGYLLQAANECNCIMKSSRKVHIYIYSAEVILICVIKLII